MPISSPTIISIDGKVTPDLFDEFRCLNKVQVGDKVFIYAAETGIYTSSEHVIHVFEQHQDGSITTVMVPDPNDPSREIPHIIEDDDALELYFLHSFDTGQVGGTHFLAASGLRDQGVSVFQIDPDTGQLSHTDNVDLGPRSDFAPQTVSWSHFVTIEDQTFLIVPDAPAGSDGTTVQVYELDEAGQLTQRSQLDLPFNGLNAPRIVQPIADSDLQVVVKLESPMDTAFQEQGLAFALDTDNYAVFDFYHDGTDYHVFSSSLTRPRGPSIA